MLSKQQLSAHLLHMSGEKDASGTIDVTVERKGKGTQSAFGIDPTVRVRYTPSGKYTGLDRVHIEATVAPTLEGLAVASRRVTSRPRDNAVDMASQMFSGPVGAAQPGQGRGDEWISLPDIYRAIQGAQTAREASAWYHRPDLSGLYAFASAQREAELEPESYMRAGLRAVRGDAPLPADQYPNAHAARVFKMHSPAIRRAVMSDNPMDAVREAISLTRDLRGMGTLDKNEPGENEPEGGTPGKNEPGEDEPGENEPGENEPGENEPGENEPEGGTPGKDDAVILSKRAARLDALLNVADTDVADQLSKRAAGKAGTPTRNGGVEKPVPNGWEAVELTPAVARMVAAARGGDELPPMRASGAPTRRAMWALKYGLTNVFTRPPQNASHRFILIDDSGSMSGHRDKAYEIATSVSSLAPSLTHILAFSSGTNDRLAIVDVQHGMKPDKRTLGGGTPLCVAIEYLQSFMAGKLAGATVVILTDGQSGGGRHPDGGTCHASPRGEKVCIAKQMGTLANSGTNYVAIMFSNGGLDGVPGSRTVRAYGDVGGVVSSALKIVAELGGQARGRRG